MSTTAIPTLILTPKISTTAIPTFILTKTIPTTFVNCGYFQRTKLGTKFYAGNFTFN